MCVFSRIPQTFVSSKPHLASYRKSVSSEVSAFVRTRSESRQTNRDIWTGRCLKGPLCSHTQPVSRPNLPETLTTKWVWPWSWLRDSQPQESSYLVVWHLQEVVCNCSCIFVWGFFFCLIFDFNCICLIQRSPENPGSRMMHSYCILTNSMPPGSGAAIYGFCSQSQLLSGKEQCFGKNKHCSHNSTASGLNCKSCANLGRSKELCVEYRTSTIFFCCRWKMRERGQWWRRRRKLKRLEEWKSNSYLKSVPTLPRGSGVYEDLCSFAHDWRNETRAENRDVSVNDERWM